MGKCFAFGLVDDIQLRCCNSSSQPIGCQNPPIFIPQFFKKCPFLAPKKGKIQQNKALDTQQRSKVRLALWFLTRNCQDIGRNSPKCLLPWWFLIPRSISCWAELYRPKDSHPFYYFVVWMVACRLAENVKEYQ